MFVNILRRAVKTAFVLSSFPWVYVCVRKTVCVCFKSVPWALSDPSENPDDLFLMREQQSRLLRRSLNPLTRHYLSKQEVLNHATGNRALYSSLCVNWYLHRMESFSAFSPYIEILRFSTYEVLCAKE